MTPVKVKLVLGSYWLTCTDHRPIVYAVQSDLFDPGQVRTTRPRATTSFQRRDLDRWDELAGTGYQDVLVRDLGHLPEVAGLSMMKADVLLQDISNKSLLALPGKNLSNIKTHRYKDGWSPCLVALEAHCHAISLKAYHLCGFGKGKWWKDSTKQSAGIRLAVDELERTAYDLKWPDWTIPPDASIGLFLTEWRLQTDDTPGNLLQCCHSDLKQLTKRPATGARGGKRG